MKKITLLLLLFLPLAALSQKLDLDLVKEMKPRNIGPGGMSGRVTGIDVVESDPNIMYAGTASGGLWKSVSGGTVWEPIFDDQFTASIGAVAVQQSNPSVVWVGTGEGNPRNSLNGGYGIFKSLDGGKSWKSMGLEKTRHIHRVIIDPTNPDVVYAAAIGSPWGEHPERGVFKTIDGGKTWNKILYTNDKSGAADLIMDASNPNKLIAAMWEHKRDPWFFKSGGEGSGLYITHDGGDNWKKIGEEEGLPKGELGRIGVAIAPSNPNTVYALVEAKKNALYKSTDGGFNWKMINDKSDIGNRPFYYSEIYVDPGNENRVYSVFTYVNVSDDGGRNFDQLMNAYGANNGIHPDHHAFYIHPQDGNFIIDGNDGGLNISQDRGKTWRFIGNIPVAQFYHINVDMETPYNVYGGMQDNGSWRGPAYVWRDQGIRNSYWQEISFGDGFDVIPDPDNNRFGYTMSQQGSVQRYDWETGNNYSVQPTHPDPSVDLRFNWNSAIQMDPFDSSTLFFGSQFVHKSTDKGLTWTVISPDLTTDDPDKQKQGESGGLTLDATGAENHTTILVIEPSAAERGVIYTGSDDGLVYVTKNGGDSWDEVSKGLKGLPEGSWIAQIKASTTKKGHALLIANDYRRFNYEPYAYRTTNYGKSWNRIVDKDDVQSYTLSIIEDPKENNLMFLGTDDGLYVSIDAGDNWTKYTNGFPTVSVKDLVIHPREQDLVIGTFGRAAWVLDDIRPLQEMARNKAKFEQPIKLFESPNAYQTRNQQPTGSRFGADAMYQGENRSSNAQFRYYFDKDLLKKADTTATDSVFLKIYDKDRLIRTLKSKAPEKKGVQEWSWRMRESGKNYPSRRYDESDRENAGVEVLPGTYRAVLEYAGYSSQNQIVVSDDPRISEVTAANRKAKYDAMKKIEDLADRIYEVTQDLAKNKKTAESFKKMLTEKDKKAFKEQIKATDSIVKQIETQQALYFGAIDDRQGITRNKETTVSQRLGMARSYISSRQGAQTATETQLYNQAETMAEQTMADTMQWLSTEWESYKNQMKKTDIDIWED
ncbi:WD40/YVTN/BNR-like repeat-containing protein [Nonlabens antarcticus]|uniref:WD40/YVTN/BNR-like repeat-containing protein n=1 Tax=Nonlabens antarcticus TaxID=392714 RepID=UPI001890F50E|nr:hypothetical protein [Nonlabens antarcticus]